MKKILTICAFAAAAFTFSSCGVSDMISNNVTQTQVVLSEDNFEVVGQAYGEASTTYIFGIGGLSKETLRNNAINEMSKNARLKGSQTLTNITTQMGVKMVTPIYIELTFSATANIVEFK